MEAWYLLRHFTMAISFKVPNFTPPGDAAYLPGFHILGEDNGMEARWINGIITIICLFSMVSNIIGGQYLIAILMLCLAIGNLYFFIEVRR